MRRRVAAALRDGTDGCCLRRRDVRFWRGQASRREEGRERERKIFFLVYTVYNRELILER
jgi:hypothetical protein